MGIASIFDGLSNSASDPIMGLALGLLQAGGASRMPVSTGQALGQGFATAQQFQQYQQQQQALKQKQAQDAAMQQMLQNGGYKDPNTLAQMAVMGGHPDQAASIMGNQFQQMTPAQIKQRFGGAPQPGYSYQMNPFGKVNVTGESPFKQMSVMDPSTGMPIPTLIDTRNPAAIQAAKPNIGQIGQNMDRLAQMIANYKVQPSAYLLRSPQGQIVMGKVSELNPNYDQKNYPVVQAALKSFTSGKNGGIIASANKSIAHLDTLSQLAQNLDNTSLPAFNRMANAFKRETGQSAPTTFDAARNIALNEVNKFIVGAGGGVEDRDQMRKLINSSQSPQQLADNIATIKKLMGGQLMAIRKQYQSALQGSGMGNDFDQRFLYPETEQLIKQLETESQYTGQPAASQQGWSITPVNPGG